MFKLLVFDLDDTLCPSGEKIKNSTVSGLNELKEKGFTLAIASGKPVFYLMGFIRSCGLSDTYLLGENGTVITRGLKLPIKERYVYPFPEEVKEKLRKIRSEIASAIPDLYFQPNEYCITPFPRTKEERRIIDEIVKRNEDDRISVYQFPTCYDIFPSVISKGNSVKFLTEILHCDLSEVITIGDAVNDLSMFAVSGASISIGEKVKEKATYNFKDIDEALDFIAKINDGFKK